MNKHIFEFYSKLTTRKMVLGHEQYRRTRGFFRRPNLRATKMVSSRARRSNAEAQMLGGEIYRSTHNEDSTTTKISSWPSRFGRRFYILKPIYHFGPQKFLPSMCFWAAVLFYEARSVLRQRQFLSSMRFLGCGSLFSWPIAF